MTFELATYQGAPLQITPLHPNALTRLKLRTNKYVVVLRFTNGVMHELTADDIFDSVLVTNIEDTADQFKGIKTDILGGHEIVTIKFATVGLPVSLKAKDDEPCMPWSDTVCLVSRKVAMKILREQNKARKEKTRSSEWPMGSKSML